MSKINSSVVTLLVTLPIILATNIRQPNSSFSKCPELDQCRAREDIQGLPSCYCDDKCFHFMDCCKQYVSGHQNKIESTHLQRYRHSCILLTNEKSLFQERIGAFMIDNCLETNTSCKATGNDPNDMLPVSTTDETFINAECALCNGVNNFQYWKAIYEIHDEQDFEDFIERNSSEGDTLDDIHIRTFYDTGRIMHPPARINPRFCFPFDFPRDKKDIKFGLYQNAVFCNSILFKNIDVCYSEGCCMIFAFRECPRFILRFYDEHENGRTTVDTLLVTLSMDEKQTTAASSTSMTSVAKREWTFIYKYTRIRLYFEMYLEMNDTNPDFDACIHGLMLYLLNTVYKLQSVSPVYDIRTLPSGKQVFLNYFRSHASLTLAQLNTLFKLEADIQCEDMESNFVMFGKLRKAKASDHSVVWLGPSHTMVQRLFRLNLYSFTDHIMSKVCENLALKIENQNSDGTTRYARMNVHVECDDENKLQGEVNLATKQSICLINGLIVTLSFAVSLLYF